jgi:hypothetical protein
LVRLDALHQSSLWKARYAPEKPVALPLVLEGRIELLHPINSKDAHVHCKMKYVQERGRASSNAQDTPASACLFLSGQETFLLSIPKEGCKASRKTRCVSPGRVRIRY